MQITYLKKFKKFAKNKIAYVPLGTIEWHGNHLPIETDSLVAQKICKLMSKEIPGYVLPPFYLGTDKERKIGNKKYIGMNGKLRKELPGSIYYLEPETLLKVLKSLVNNLIKQGFNKIIIITGHAGSKQIKVLNQLEKDIKATIFINPFEGISSTINIHHADEYEISIFWACYPGEKKKSLAINISSNDDFINYAGYDPRKKASIKTGLVLLKGMLKSALKELKKKI